MSQAHEMTVPVLLGHYVNQSNQATLWQQKAQQECAVNEKLMAQIKELQAELDELKPKAEDSVPEEGPAA